MTLVLVTPKLMFTLPIQDGDFKSLKGDCCVVENTYTRRENLEIDKIHLNKQKPYFIYSFESKFRKYIPGISNSQNILSTKH